MKARTLVKAMTRHIWRIKRGRAESRGFSFWKAPLEVAFMGGGHDDGGGGI